MYKVLVLVFVTLSFSACSNVKISAAMCKKIESDPHSTVPQECRNYDKKAADKAFDKVTDDKKVNDKDIIEFHKEN